MESFQWLKELFTNTDSVAHIVLLYAIVIAIGVYLGKIVYHERNKPGYPENTVGLEYAHQ